MSITVNVWIAMSQQALNEYKDARLLKKDYTGPMDALTFDTLHRMADTDNVQAMFKRVPADGKEYTLFSLYLPASAEAKTRIDHIAEQWLGHFIVIGAWNWDGTQVEIAGQIVYPVHAQAWRLMPDVIEYDVGGNETSRTAATSNSDLRDINLLQGQSPRDFIA